MHDTHEVTGSTPVSPTIFPVIFCLMNRPKKSKVEWIIIVSLATLFAAIWLFAHWNLSRQPPHHKGPGSVGYEEPSTPIKK